MSLQPKFINSFVNYLVNLVTKALKQSFISNESLGMSEETFVIIFSDEKLATPSIIPCLANALVFSASIYAGHPVIKILLLLNLEKSMVVEFSLQAV